MNPLNIFKTFAVINRHKQISTETVDPSLYQRLDDNYDQFKGCELVSCYTFEDDWDSWEIHPSGDELVILLAGDITFVIDSGDKMTELQLTTAGDYAIVSQGCWHTAKVHAPSQVLFITPGEGTHHKME
jgi:uncharacterized cupin superfamily protein